MKRKFRVRAKFVWLLVIVLVLVGGFAFARSWLGQSSAPGPSATHFSQHVPYNILLIGNNARAAAGPLSLGTSGGQADILMVVHIDPTTHKVTLISVPRDLLIALPQWRDPIPKIKESFFLGLQESPQRGPQLAMQVVSHFTGMPIHAYIVTDFQGFVDAINAVGCINVYIPAKLYDPLHSKADFQKGWHCLSGTWALAYIRIRQNAAGNSFRTNDFQRMGAEQQVLLALKDKLLKDPVQAALHLPSLIAAWSKDVATNLTHSQLLALGMSLAHAHLQKVTLGSIADSMQLGAMPLQGINVENAIEGAYYDVLDTANVTRALKPYGSKGAWTGLPPFPSPTDVPVTLYGSQYVMAELQKAGFTVTYGGSSAGTTQTTVVFPNGSPTAGFVVGRALGQSNELVKPGSVAQVTVYAP
ncbi:MAG: LCP family protein [Thermaerobacter sp.]|nr:LCP family protein [Thermaerobacter sp.]